MSDGRTIVTCSWACALGRVGRERHLIRRNTIGAAGETRERKVTVFDQSRAWRNLVLVGAALAGVGLMGAPQRAHARLAWQVKAVDGVQKEQRAHALVQVVAPAAKLFEKLALGQQLGE